MKNDIGLDSYWKALDRLIRDCPNIVSKGLKITNDLVSLEAGRKKGSIKKSREQFSGLITAIEVAASEQQHKLNKQKNAFRNLKDDHELLRKKLDLSLGRELSLLQELFEVKKRLASLTGENVVPIRINSLPNP